MNRLAGLSSLRWSAAIALLLATGLALAWLAATPGGAPVAPAAPAQPTPILATEVLEGACRSTNPFVAVARFADPAQTATYATTPAILALQDSATDTVLSHVTLATQSQTGPVFGLAYDSARGHVYAAAYHKRGIPFGPGGPGAIYRVDVASGAITIWATVPAGPDRHDLADNDDEPAAEWVARSSLGDIELSGDGRELYVANLYDGFIYRFAVPDGTLLGKFRHGAVGVSSAWNLYLGGLDVYDGRVYHAVVNVADDASDNGVPAGLVYRSQPDGSAMELVATFPVQLLLAGVIGREPLIADLRVRSATEMAVQVRGRVVDSMIAPTANVPAVRTVGDLLAVARVDGTWRLADVQPFGDILPAGGITALAGPDAIVVPNLQLNIAGAAQVGAPRQVDLIWLERFTGEILRREPVATDPDGIRGYLRLATGDVEVLCPQRDGMDPDLVATATAETAIGATATTIADATSMAGTETAAATAIAGTATAFAPTLAARGSRTPSPTLAAPGTATAFALLTATPAARHFRRIEQSCGARDPYYAVPVFARDAVTGELSREPAIVAFNGREREQISLAAQVDVGSIYGLAHDWRRGQLYASAYHKRGAILGPAGMGTIYRIDLATGSIQPWVEMDTGPEIHDYTVNFDAIAGPWVGKLGIGDIDLAEDGSELYALNLFDQRIYRFSVPDGELRGSFLHGGAQERWRWNAQPMGLGVRQGLLYHGVVNSGQFGVGRMEAVVYRSWPDGSDLTPVVRFDLDYRTPVDWRAWGSGGYQAALSDIEFTKTGDMLVGLRDRRGDTELFGMAYGDLVPARALDTDQPRVILRPEFYREQNIHPEALWGGLAAVRIADEVVSTVLDPLTIYSGGVQWFSNTNGLPLHAETIYRTDQGELTFGKAQGLGDLEALCPPEELPTLTPSPSRTATEIGTPTAPWTPSFTPTFTATATDTPTGTSSPTATPVPTPIYLPFADRRPCRPEEHFTDAVLVLDMSTSMYRQTRTGRTKHQAAIEAARIFSDLMDLEAVPDDQRLPDRLGIVGFNDYAWTEVGLTDSRPAVHQALGRLMSRIQEGTRLDLALQQGQATLAASPREGVTPVMILLTDGLPNRVPYGPGGTMQETVIAQALAARSEGTRIFTIGLGLPDDVLRDLLETVASSPGDYYYAPDGDDLEAIYRQIAGRVIECP